MWHLVGLVDKVLSMISKVFSSLIDSVILCLPVTAVLRQSVQKRTEYACIRL